MWDLGLGISGPLLTMAAVLDGAKFLSADQFLLTTLIVKLAVMAVLATMLARYRRFRHILIFERRGWLDRLVFTLALGIPLMAGVTARLLLNYKAADLTLEGAFLAGLIAGPYTGALVGLLVGIPASIAGEFIALPFAVGCGFAGGGLREACPKEAIWQFTPFVFMDLHKHVWQMVRKLGINWQLWLLLAPVALELLRQALGARFGVSRLFYPGADLGTPSPLMMLLIILATVLAVATPIKIWNSARIEHRLQEQEKLLLAAKIEALKSQINPHFLFNTLTSISSLIRSQPDTARTLIIKLSGAPAPAAAQPRALRHAAGGARVDRRVPRHRGRALRAEAARAQGDRARHARRRRAEHDSAAARRELDQARPVAQGRRRHDRHPQLARARRAS